MLNSDDWPLVKLGDVVEFRTGKLDSNQAVENGEYPFFTCSPETLRINRFSFDTEAVLLAGNNANAIYPVKYYKGKFDAYQRTYIITPKNPENLNCKYLYYQTQILSNLLTEYSLGTATKFLTMRILNALEIPLPPIGEQCAIARILGALDDKIELNRRMNQTLESMAQALFKSWFVDFDPVTAKSEGRALFGMSAETAALFPAEFVDAELGAIPQGWRVGRLSEIAQVASGKRPGERSTEKTPELQVPLFGGGGIMAFVREPLYSQPVLITGRVGTIGQVYRISYPCWASDNTLVLTPKQSDHFEYVYFHLLDADFDEITRGSTQPLVTQTDIQAQKIVIAPDTVVQAFHQKTHSLLNKIDQNDKESRTLASIRDALLPRLLSGEVRVKNGLPSAERING